MRVIAGTLGGRSLVAPKGQNTRPTSDRVREALFSVLGDVTDAAVLDLYAGTGALGIEALSRGATRAVFVENARPALDVLRRNIDSLALRAVTVVISSPVHRAVRSLSGHGPFDLILVDPPYADLDEAGEAIEVLVAQGLCSERVCVVLEHASRDAAPDLKGLERQATRRYGDTSLAFYSGRTIETDALDEPDDVERRNGNFDESKREDVSSEALDG